MNSSRGGGSKDTWVLAGTAAHGRAEPHAPATRAAGARPAARRRPGDRVAARSRTEQQQQTSSAGRRCPVLSRIAESLFWIGRYVERAEDTARILDVQTQLMLEDPCGRRGHRPAARLLVDHGRRDPPRTADPGRPRCCACSPTTPTRRHVDRGGPRRRARERPPRPRDAVDRRCGRRSTRPTARSRRAASARCARRTPSGGCASGPP